MGIEAFPTDWAIYSRVLIVAAILCLIAMIVLAVSAISDYLRRWRENRRMCSIVQTKQSPLRVARHNAAG